MKKNWLVGLRGVLILTPAIGVGLYFIVELRQYLELIFGNRNIVTKQDYYRFCINLFIAALFALFFNKADKKIYKIWKYLLIAMVILSGTRLFSAFLIDWLCSDKLFFTGSNYEPLVIHLQQKVGAAILCGEITIILLIIYLRNRKA
ncbi:hypothetical protein SAMN05660826_01802 [Caldanaerovirga acetigignens]|uniref:Uncharacterized protein n=1 Tax=Caldanaerovirga acetigignens TaxID=447595 RepID=A0A1M7L6U5_9FIRM|nr:hypothetical protein [Caldanaerovirga acetigignens]SHM73852.1 hypothetical protein SAMN05660826_01802 [Caldanaerovirga acetigignens]